MFDLLGQELLRAKVLYQCYNEQCRVDFSKQKYVSETELPGSQSGQTVTLRIQKPMSGFPSSRNVSEAYIPLIRGCQSLSQASGQGLSHATKADATAPLGQEGPRSGAKNQE